MVLKTEARRLFQSGAVKINGEKVVETFEIKYRRYFKSR
jgi:tyrosyl-tRNA synthetase